MRSDCLTLVDSATATSKPRPVATSAPEPARPIFKMSRRVTAVTATPAAASVRGQHLDASSRMKRCQVESELDGSAGGHLQVASVIVAIRVAQEIDDARIPGHDDAGGAGRLVSGERLPPGRPINRHRDLDPRSEEHTSELQSPYDLVCRLLLE